MKNAQKRWTDTITFISKNPLPAGGNPTLMNPILEALRSTPTAIQNALSPMMSQDGVNNRPKSEPDRDYRRACIMLKCRFLYPQANWQAAINEVNNNYKSNYATWYKTDLGYARDKVYSSSEVARSKFNELVTQPEQFMKQYLLSVQGTDDRKAETYGFYMKSEGIYKLGPDSLTLKNAELKDLKAINVPAKLYAETIKPPNTINQIEATVSSVDATCTLVLTTQFSGCCYCFMVNGSNYAAAHIDPGRGEGASTGEVISQALRAHGGFRNGNGGTFKAYGRVGDGSGLFGYGKSVGYTIIIAVKHSNTWEVYAQLQHVDKHVEVKRIDQ